MKKSREINLNEFYRKVKKRGISSYYRWPPELKNLRWGEGFRHPLTASIYVDIRSFTRRVMHDPQGNYITLQLFFLAAWKILEDYDCYVEKQTGDGLMIVYPIDSEDELEKPLVMAVEIMEFFKNKLNPFLKRNGIEPLVLGIGIDAGEVVVTKVGLAHHESHLMLFGSETNFAAKISGLGKNEILIGCCYKEHLAEKDKKYKNLELKKYLDYEICNHPKKACNGKKYRVYRVK